LSLSIFFMSSVAASVFFVSSGGSENCKKKLGADPK
jgi:hypothetical protein